MFTAKNGCQTFRFSINWLYEFKWVFIIPILVLKLLDMVKSELIFATIIDKVLFSCLFFLFDLIEPDNPNTSS